MRKTLLELIDLKSDPSAYDDILLFGVCNKYLDNHYPEVLKTVMPYPAQASVRTKYEKVRYRRGMPHFVIYEPHLGYSGLALWLFNKTKKPTYSDRRYIVKFKKRKWRTEVVIGSLSDFMHILKRYLEE